MNSPKIYSGIIYQAINLINKKSYIGYTSKILEKRINEHLRSSIREQKKGFHGALRKYGEHNFKWIILGEISTKTKKELKQQLKKAEIESIWLFRTYGSDGENYDDIYGYNLTKGGDGRNGPPWNKGMKGLIKRSEESVQKGIETKRKKGTLGFSRQQFLKGLEIRRKNGVSKESREKNRNAHLGKIVSEETKDKLKIKRKGKTPSLGMKHTEEWCINHSLKMSGENSPKAKPFYQLDNNFDIIKRFGTVKEAAKIFNIHRNHIDKSCKNKTIYNDNYFIYEGELDEFIKKNCIKHSS